MKNHNIPEIFRRFLQNESKAEEIKIMLKHFGSKKHDDELTKLIDSEFENPFHGNLENNAKVDAVFLRVHEQIKVKIAQGDVQNPIIVPLRAKLLRWTSIAASVILVSALGYFGRDLFQSPSSKMQKLITINGERKQLKLADGSVIWLNPKTTLTYPEKFNGKTREVYLSGEAFFEVAKDKEHPFIVHSEQVNTQVLGTSFNIKSYSGQQDIQVTLLTGKVAVNVQGEKGKSTEIVPNQKVTYNKTSGALIKEGDINAKLFLDRKNGKLIYKGIELRNVINDLELFYNIKVNIATKMDHCLFYGNIDTAEEAELAIQQIALTFNGKFNRINNQTWEIVNAQCYN